MTVGILQVESNTPRIKSRSVILTPRLCLTTHPCRWRSADLQVSVNPSEFYETPSNPYAHCHHPTVWTFQCRSPTLCPRRNDRVAPEEGVWSTPTDSDWQNGICSLHWWMRRKNIGYSEHRKRSPSLIYFMALLDLNLMLYHFRICAVRSRPNKWIKYKWLSVKSGRGTSRNQCKCV